MSEEFSIELLTPGRMILKAQATEVVLPAYDGEVGVLAKHHDFIGLVGTGTLKVVKGGDDYWYMVSCGLYQVRAGALTLFAELAEAGQDIDAEPAQARARELEALFRIPERFDPAAYPAQKLEYEQNMARIEAHRRTRLVN